MPVHRTEMVFPNVSQIALLIEAYGPVGLFGSIEVVFET